MEQRQIAAIDSNPLLSLLRDCVVRIDRDGEFAGSGFFIAPNEVLTCAHVVAGAGKLTVGKGAWQSPGAVVGQASTTEGDQQDFYRVADIALVRVEVSPADQPCTEIGLETPTAGDHADILRLAAFCRDVYRPDAVEPNGASVEFEDTVGELGLLKLREGQVIAGFSGAPALNLRTGLVCGIVDSSRGETSDLGGFAVPMGAVQSQFPELIERNAAFHAKDSTWKAARDAERTARAKQSGEVERLPLLQPPYEPAPGIEYAPSELLKPRLGIVDLVGRQELQAQLMRWRESEKRLGILLLTGGGGVGKTRLALEECVRADRSGWTAGLLALDKAANLDLAVERFAEWPGDLFLAIDYAETRPALVAALIQRIVRRPEGPRTRLILVSRQGGDKEALEKRFAVGDDRDSVVAQLRQAEPLALTDPEFQLDSQELFNAGVLAFSRYVGGSEGSEPPRVSLSKEHFSRPLFVLAAALLRAEDPSIDIDALGRDELMLKLLDEHESLYWARWDEELSTGLDPSLRACAVAIATLLGAADEDEALSLVSMIPGVGEESPERRRQIASWCSHLYSSGSLTDNPAIAPVEPDMLAEALVARECTARPGLIGVVLDKATDRQLARALNVLTRAVAGNDRLGEVFGAELEKMLPAVVGRSGSSSVEASDLASAVDLAVAAMQPLANAAEAAAIAQGDGNYSLAASLYRLALERHKQLGLDRPRARGTYANLLNGFAGVLDNLGQSEEAFEMLQEVVDTYRTLGEQESEQYLPMLAMSLNNLANVLDTLERSEEALSAIEEAVSIYRGLSESEAEKYTPQLATSLSNLSNVLDNLARSEEALEAVQEAVAYRRELLAQGREQFLPDLAGSLNNLATVLENLGHGKESLEAASESAKYYRVLAELSPERYSSDLAAALNNLATALDRNGQTERAAETIEEAVAHYRALAEKRPERYVPYLAGSLNNLTNRLYNLGHHQRALQAIEEAVSRYRPLTQRYPERYAADMAMSLNNLSNVLDNVGQTDAALRAIEEAIEHRREMVKQSPERFVPDLASSLNNLATVLGNLGRAQEGRAAIEEAMEHYRALTEHRPERYVPDLATSLNNLATVLGDCDQNEEALVAIEEAIEHRREMVKQNPERYLADLAASLNNLSNILGNLGRLNEALAAIEEAIEHRREMVKQSPERYLPLLSGSLNNLGSVLNGLDRPEEALEALEEALRIYRLLAKQNPDRYVPFLSRPLTNFANALRSLGRGEEGRKAIEECLSDHSERVVSGHLHLALARWDLRADDRPGAVENLWAAVEKGKEAPAGSSVGEARRLLCSLRIEDEAEFDEIWKRCVGADLPVWLRLPSTDTGLADLLIEWIQTPGWRESRAFLEKHDAALLNEQSEATLEHLIDQNPGLRALPRHLEMLRSARGEGLGAPYDRIDEEGVIHRRRGKLQEWLGAQSWEKSLALLNENSGALLDPQSARDLLAVALQHPTDSSIFTYIALLDLARDEGADAAYALLTDGAQPLEDPDCLRAREEPRALSLARLGGGMHGDDPERQLHHALSAAVAGNSHEAEQAIGRCVSLVPSWVRLGYHRRLELLIADHPDLDGSLARLKSALLGPPATELSPDNLP